MIVSSQNFGVLTPEKFDDGTYKYLIYKDANGVQWHDLVEQFGPFDWYIAIDDNGKIVSMESDPDATQIGGREIIGLRVDGDFHFTRGPGGTVYGKVWSGDNIVDPPIIDLLPDEISRRQFFQYLAVIGIISKAEALSAMQGGLIPAPLQAIIDQLPTEDDQFNAQMFVVGAQNFNRMHWLTDVVREAMHWTPEQRDDFWRGAAKL